MAGLAYPAIFLDRDGVIIENRAAYVRSWDDVAIFGQALDALAKVADLPQKIFIVTNQSAVGRGLLSLRQVVDINRQIVSEIERAGGRIDETYICPHAPQDGCDCRKPRPGLIEQAAREFSIDLANSVLIGDALTDLQAGLVAGIGRVALVETGRGLSQLQLPGAEEIQPFDVYEDLSAAFRDLFG